MNLLKKNELENKINIIKNNIKENTHVSKLHIIPIFRYKIE